MKRTSFLLLLTISSFAWSQSDRESIEAAGYNYLDGFYQGDTTKLISSLSPELYKYGYWKSKSGDYGGEAMTYRQALDYAKKVMERKSFARPDAPRKVELLDVQEFVAAIKITAWWGIDYALLSKKDNSWKIEQVLWQGPIETIK